MTYDVYQEPLISRYTSVEMQKLFSEEIKFQTWRRCWVALAEAQYELGLTDLISLEMLNAMRDNIANIDFALAREKEKEIRHDVMAHVYEFGTKAPIAEGIIHLGATSQFVVCNTDLIVQKKGLLFIKNTLLSIIRNLADFCNKYKNLATLGYTHYQPAQPTTVGKRNCLYIQDLLLDFGIPQSFDRKYGGSGCKRNRRHAGDLSGTVQGRPSKSQAA